MSYKRAISAFIIIFVSAVFLLLGTAVLGHAVFAAGDTAIDPILINSADDLIALSDAVAAGQSTGGKYYRLENDIDLTATGFSPIGSNVQQFNGNFDGNGHTVTVDISKNAIYVGFFGHLGLNAVIENIILAGSVSGGNYTGGIAGYSNGLIKNCINNASVSSNDGTHGFIGGITGMNKGIIRACINLGAVSGKENVGGITGENSGSGTNGIYASINGGAIAVNVSGGSRIGGIVGLSRAVIADAYNTGIITVVSGTASVGSTIGYLGAVEAGSKNCYNIIDYSTRTPIGARVPAPPESFSYASAYQIMQGIVEFSSDAFYIPAALQGEAFLPYPVGLDDVDFVFDSLKFSIFNSGNGSSISPFVIRNSEQWKLFYDNSKVFSYEDKYITIDSVFNPSLTNVNAPLFGGGELFLGHFNGNGRTVNLSLSGGAYQGLFAKIGYGATVKNLNLTGSISATNYAGSIAGFSEGDIENVTSACTIAVTNSYAGGIAGEIKNANLINLSNSGTVRGISFIGGIAGTFIGTVVGENLYNTGAVTGIVNNASNFFGGICGRADNLEISDALNTAVISASSANVVGGLIGYANEIDGERLVSTGAVAGRTYVGGIIGRVISSSVLSDLSVMANISGAVNVGGLVGHGIVTISRAVFSGAFSGVTGAATDQATVKAIGNGTISCTEIYYNSDLASDTAGYGRTAVALAKNDIFNNPWWNCSFGAYSDSFGYFPVPVNANLTTAQINSSYRYYYFHAGSGSDGDRFILASEQHIRNMSELVNGYENYLGMSYQQAANITLSKTHTPIGTETSGFYGKLDGGNYLINGISVSRTNSYSGLFGVITSGAIIERVRLESGDVSGTDYVGGIAGTVGAGAIVRTSYSAVTVYGTNYVGGISGRINGNIAQCFNAGRITGQTNIGGIAGMSAISAQVTECFNAGFIGGNDNIGGIIGQNSGRITGCHVAGSINVFAGVSHAKAGGFAGFVTSADNSVSNGYIIAKFVSKQGDARIGTFAGEVSSGTPFASTCYFNSEILTNITQSYYLGGAVSLSGGRTTQQIVNTNFLTQLGGGYYTQGAARQMDSDYSPVQSGILAAFGDSDYVKIGSRLHLFGWDSESLFAWGTDERNPYLISTEAQLSLLRTLNMTYDYSGRYFKLTRDLDMRGESGFAPIGRYFGQANSLNYAFNATFDGAGHTVEINFNLDYGYVGLFGLTGTRFVLKNLVLGGNSIIQTSGNSGSIYAGSLVGYNQGAVLNCFSFATVSVTASGTAVGYSGGLIGYTVNGTRVENSVFYGKLPKGGYGILGNLSTSNVSVTIKNTYFVYVREGTVPLNAQNLPYSSNNYGSVLYVDINGSVVLAAMDISKSEAEFIGFSAIGTNGNIKPYLMSGTDNKLFNFTANGVYYPLKENASVQAGNQVTLFVRFTQSVGFDFSDGTSLIESASGTGEYYHGQQVSVTLSLKYDAYLDISKYGAGFSLSNNGDRIIIRFNMEIELNESAVLVEISVLPTVTKVEIASIDFSTNDTYDGQEKFAEVNVSDISVFNADIADNISYFYGVNLSAKDFMLDAGVYRVRARLYPAGRTDLVIGIIEKVFTVKGAEITVSDQSDAYWNEVFAVKDYDGEKVSYNVPVDIGYMSGVISAGISITADITWNDKNAASSKTAVITIHTVSGDAAHNYALAGGVISFSVTDAKINVKHVIVSLNANDRKSQYTGSSPAISNEIPDTVLKGAELSFTLTPVDAAPNWGAGSYTINVFISDTVNYSVELASADRVYTISKQQIPSLEILNTSGLVYNNSNIGANIRAQYRMVGGGISQADIVFYSGSYNPLYPENNEVTEVKNAGLYVGVATINALNYELRYGEQTFNVTVAKSPFGDALSFTLENNEVTIGSRLKLTNCSGIYAGASLQIVEISERAAAIIENESGEYYFKPLAYGAVTAVRFKISAVGADNYIDRTSGFVTVSIFAGTLYVGVSNPDFVYGDEILPILQYSRDFEQANVLTAAEADSIADEIGGTNYFTASTWRLVSSVFNAGTTYNVVINPGESAGYRILLSKNTTVTIHKKVLGIIVASDDAENKKIYGDADAEIKFIIARIINAENEEFIQVDTLPNGNPILIAGVLSRAAGEQVGRYKITANANFAANNPNYDLSFFISGEIGYEILRREISITIPSQGKEYGAPEPILYGELAEGSSWGFNDTFYDITLRIWRAIGETVGNYTVDFYYERGINYEIISVVKEGNFTISPATPVLSATSRGVWQYGNPVSTVTLDAAAWSHGTLVAGSFAWENPNFVPSTVGAATVWYTFTPGGSNAGNYKSARGSIIISVGKRIAEIHFEGALTYSYNGQKQCGITAVLFNTVGTETVALNTEVLGGAINVGTYKFRATLQHNNYEIENGFEEISFTITKAIINVSVKGGDFVEGDKIKLPLTYTGFVNGENISNLKKQAEVNTPSTSGFYTVLPFGAESDNYLFTYTPAEVAIFRAQFSTADLTVSGKLNPEFSADSTRIDNSSRQFASTANELEKALQVNILIPSKLQMTGYTKLSFNNAGNQSFTLTVSLSTPISANHKVYICYADGRMVPLIDGKLPDEAPQNAAGLFMEGGDAINEITFLATGDVIGIAVFSEKDTVTLLKGYIPLAAVCLGSVILLIIIISFIVWRVKKARKQSKLRKHYLNN